MSGLPIPLGWYQLAWSDELRVGAVEPVHAFGRELVVWRTDDGGAHVADRHCPHMGASLAHGGRVAGCELICPFHGWRWSGEGRNTSIHGSQRVNSHAELRMYPLLELAGVLLVWFDGSGATPPWEPDSPAPEIAGFVGGTRIVRRVRAPWQEIAEGAVDQAHLLTVHGTTRTIDVVERTFPDHRWSSRTEVPPLDGGLSPVSLLTSEHHGPGFGWTIFRGQFDTAVVGSTMPIDEATCVVRLTCWWRADDPAFAEVVGREFVAELEGQLDQDIPIWENKIRLDRPLLSDVDGPILQFRRWAEQFVRSPGDDV